MYATGPTITTATADKTKTMIVDKVLINTTLAPKPLDTSSPKFITVKLLEINKDITTPIMKIGKAI